MFFLSLIKPLLFHFVFYTHALLNGFEKKQPTNASFFFSLTLSLFLSLSLYIYIYIYYVMYYIDFLVVFVMSQCKGSTSGARGVAMAVISLTLWIGLKALMSVQLAVHIIALSSHPTLLHPSPLLLSPLPLPPLEFRDFLHRILKLCRAKSKSSG